MDLLREFSNARQHYREKSLKQLVYHERVKSEAKFSFEVLPSVILFISKMAF